MPRQGYAGSQTESIDIAIRTELAQNGTSHHNTAMDWPRLSEFYQALAFQAAWVNDDGPQTSAESWLMALHKVEDDGLDASDYHLDDIHRLWSARTPQDLAWLDILLTDAFFRYGLDTTLGRTKIRRRNPNWQPSAISVDVVKLLQDTLTNQTLDQTLKDLVPPHTGYWRLRTVLGTYRALAELGGWPHIPDGPNLTTGSHHPSIKPLRSYLRLTGDLEATLSDASDAFDDDLAAALQRFQRRHDLPATGILNSATRTALNVPLSERIAQIRHNLERWRWLPRDLGSHYLMVNIPEYLLRVMENGKTIEEIKVVVGKPDWPTPLVSSVLNRIIFNPFWHVPPRLATQDLLPIARRNPGYFARRGIKVFRGSTQINPMKIAWNQLSSNRFPYQLRQDPGTGNSLGRLKFLFPNSYDVYLHDTPARALFQRAVRPFSHGCVRVNNPEKFAALLLNLQGNTDWNEKKIHAAIASGRETPINLVNPIPIYLSYWTAWVDEQGLLNFRPDVYRWEK